MERGFNCRSAAANLAGFPISKTLKEGEYAIIAKIVQEILDSMQPHGMEKNLIGIESRIDKLYTLLDMTAMEEVRVVGICGMGGIGKTTIAQALFRRISIKFEHSSFVEDVRENSFNIFDIMFRKGLYKKMVLLVLDNVDDVKQLEFLDRKLESFGPGSKIIITTRNEHLLSEADVVYRPDFLLMDQALELFCRNAFKKSRPPKGYEEASNLAIRYASCLPLALKVLGSFFKGRELGVWESALNRLAKTPDNEIFEKLKLSYDGLQEVEKQIFLDIACFFKGKDIEHVTKVLDSFGFFPEIGISVLIEKSLITVSNKRIDMHDLIQEMGWRIARDNVLDIRLWKLEEIHDVINKNMSNLEAIKAIMLPDDEYDIDQYKEKLRFSANVFRRMKHLRLLDIDWEFTSHEPVVLPLELRWLCWNEYPFSSFPLTDKCKLYGLEMNKGNIKHLWKGRKSLPNLKFVHLESLHSLKLFPDVSGAPNIERLVLSYCEQLVEVHKSLLLLKRLVYLEMTNCSKLKSLPSMMKMESLETLILKGSKSLKRFPEVSPCMTKLLHVNLKNCHKIEELPSSIRYLSSLSSLDLTDCRRLKIIPNSICELKNLNSLSLYDCENLQKMPEELGVMKKLEELRLGSKNYIQRLTSIDFHTLSSLSSLRKLDLSGRKIEEQSFPQDPDVFSFLEELNLSGNSELIRLPAIICRLCRLKCLELNECHQLRTLYVLPSCIQILKANECSSLEKIGDLSKACEWLYKLWLINCHKLQQNQENERYLDKSLQQSFLEKCAAVNHRLSITMPGREIPGWFKEQKHGCEIALKLTPQWHTEIIGFVVCGVFLGKWGSQDTVPKIVFRIVNDGKVIHKSEVAGVDASETAENGNVWMSYMPLGFFQQMYHDFQPEDWSHMEGNLVMTIKSTDYNKAVRCGAHVVYKEGVEAVQQSRACMSDYGNLVHVHHKDVGYGKIISGNTYVYEEKSSDSKILMPSGSRTSRRLVSSDVCICAHFHARRSIAEARHG